jgi:hypothetical protein
MMKLNGIHISLMVGPAVPVPVGRDVLDALQEMQVTVQTSGVSAFQLSFRLSHRSPLHTLFLLSSGASIPLVRVVILVTLAGQTHVIMDGVMTNHEVSSGSGQRALTVTGEDLSRVMDYVDFTGVPYPAMPPFTRVYTMLAKYAAFGVIPLAVPSVMLDVPIPISRIPRQEGTDLAYIRQLADEVGYVFYVEPGPAPGTSKAYWGPEIRISAPQRALNADMDALSNVDNINTRFDTEQASMPILFVYNEETHVAIPVPLPNVNPLSPPLGAVSPIPKRFEYITETARLSLAQAAMVGIAKASKDADAVSATGTLDVVRYGGLLKARRLVGLRGVGLAFDGLYFVRSVTHKIKRGEYKQDFTLIRNGLISTLPRIPV